MSLEHAILGFLDQQPATGYDLKKLFDASVQHFWPADQSQIYRSLNRMRKQGWVERTVVEQHDRPDRKVYSILPAGREELIRWLETAIPQNHDHRSAELVRVFFAGKLSDETIEAMFEGWLQKAVMLKDIYQAVEADMDNNPACTATPRENYFRVLTLKYGIRAAEGEIAWLTDALHDLRSGEINTYNPEEDCKEIE